MHTIYTEMAISKKILLNHGSGGKLTHELIKEVFVRYFSNGSELPLTDSAIIDGDTQKLAFTTDSYVVDPIFFPGGDIGKLAVCGTVNDLAVCGAIPEYLSCGFIIEEGFEFEKLIKIVSSMARTADKAGVKIITGDTKVVDKGKCDKIFINTAGVGRISLKNENIASGINVKPGDKIIINGGIAEHGMAILAEREGLKFDTGILSDCAPLNKMIEQITTGNDAVKFMRDATRGGLATVLCEIAESRNLGIDIHESEIPIKDNVRGICDLLGFDPLYVANEGKVVIIVDPLYANRILEGMKKNELGKHASVIGEVVDDHEGLVAMETEIGGRRIVDMLAGEQLPRIC